MGTVRWGYRTVASLGAWTFEPSDDGGMVTATLTDCDEFGLQQGPLVARMPMGRAEWRWPVRGVARDGSTLTLQVGPAES